MSEHRAALAQRIETHRKFLSTLLKGLGRWQESDVNSGRLPLNDMLLLNITEQMQAQNEMALLILEELEDIVHDGVKRRVESPSSAPSLRASAHE